MYCTTPAFDELLEWNELNEQSDDSPNTGISKRSVIDILNTDFAETLNRHRRQALTAPAASTDITANPDVAVNIQKMYLDGVTRYRDVPSALPDYHQLHVHVNPTMEPFDGGEWTHRPHWPHKDNHIQIKVSNFNPNSLFSF